MEERMRSHAGVTQCCQVVAWLALPVSASSPAPLFVPAERGPEKSRLGARRGLAYFPRTASSSKKVARRPSSNSRAGRPRASQRSYASRSPPTS